MRAEDEEGWLISRLEVFQKPEVLINAKTSEEGWIEAELLDRNDRVLPGFSRQDCVRFQGDSVRGSLSWKMKEFPDEWLKKAKKIRFFIKDADIYSYLPSAIDLDLDDGWPDF